MPYIYHLFCSTIRCQDPRIVVLPVAQPDYTLPLAGVINPVVSTGYINLPSIILTILAILVIIIFGGSIYSFVYGIFLFIFSRGKEESLSKAVNSFRYALIWILLTLFLLFAFPFLLSQMGIPQAKDFTADKVFQRASNMIRFIFFQNRNTYTPDLPSSQPGSDLPTEL